MYRGTLLIRNGSDQNEAFLWGEAVLMLETRNHPVFVNEVPR